MLVVAHIASTLYRLFWLFYGVLKWYCTGQYIHCIMRYPVSVTLQILFAGTLVSLFTFLDYYRPLHNIAMDMTKLTLLLPVAVVYSANMFGVVVLEGYRPIVCIVIYLYMGDNSPQWLIRYMLATPNAKEEFCESARAVYDHARLSLSFKKPCTKSVSFKAGKKGGKQHINEPQPVPEQPQALVSESPARIGVTGSRTK